MNIVKKNSQDDISLCAFVESLPLGQLYWLITTPPLGDDILDHALSCDKCAGRVEQAGEDAFSSLPLNEQREHREVARRILRQEARPASPTFRRDQLGLAASEGEEIPNETAGRVPFAAFDVSGKMIEALADVEGMVFLRGEVPSGAKKLYLGQDEFVLKRLSEMPEVEIENLGSVDLEEFLDRHRRDPKRFPIRFGE